MTHQRSNSRSFTGKAHLMPTPATAPSSLDWRERFAPKRYRDGGTDGQDGVISPTCPNRGPQNSGGIARNIPETILA